MRVKAFTRSLRKSIKVEVELESVGPPILEAPQRQAQPAHTGAARTQAKGSLDTLQ